MLVRPETFGPYYVYICCAFVDMDNKLYKMHIQKKSSIVVCKLAHMWRQAHTRDSFYDS